MAEVLCRIFRTHHCNLKGPEYILLGSSNCWCGKAWNPIEQEGGEALLNFNININIDLTSEFKVQLYPKIVWMLVDNGLQP